jgi:putative ABC transport system permease protein
MLAIREMTRRRLQFGLVTGVVTLIAYLVLMVTGLGLGLNQAAGTALLALDGDYLAYSDRSNLSVIRSQLSEAQAADIAAAPGVTASAPIGYVAAAIEFRPGEVDTGALLGIDLGTIAEPAVVQGRALTEADTRGLLVDRTWVSLTGTGVGDTLQVPVGLAFEPFEIVGVVDEGSFFFQPAMFMLRDTWRQVSYRAVDQATPFASVVLLQGTNLEGASGAGWEVVTKDTAFWNIEGVSAQQGTVDALRYMGLLIGAMVIGVFFYVITLQKVSLLGVLKAIGASGTYLTTQGLLQVFLVSLTGTAMAAGLAVLTKATVLSSDAIPIAFTTGAILSSSVAVVVAGVVGALLSMRQISSIDPIIAMQQQQ